jgi:hypothetical protein
MQKMRLSIALVVFLPGVAFSEDAGDVLRSFGLLGTWSSDCSKDASDAGGPIRTTYTASPVGSPTKHTIVRVRDTIVNEEHEIQSADLVTEDKLKFTTVKTKLSFSSDKEVHAPANPPPYLSIVQKFGSRIRTMDLRSSDGSNVVIENGEMIFPNLNVDGNRFTYRLPTPLLEKCLD